MRQRLFAGVTQRVTERRAYVTAMREHDEAMRDRRVALEHAEAINRAQSRGEPGCMFCQ